MTRTPTPVLLLLVLLLLLLQLLLLDGCIDGGSLQLPEKPPPKSQEEKSQGPPQGAPPKGGRGKGAPAASASAPAAGGPPPLPGTPPAGEGGPPVEMRAPLPPVIPKPFIVWEAKETVGLGFRFYRGRQFMSCLAYTLDHAGGVWVYLLPKQKPRATEDKTTKGGKAATGKPKNLAQRLGHKP